MLKQHTDVGQLNVQGFNWKNMEVYIDDILVKSLKAEDHLEHLKLTV